MYNGTMGYAGGTSAGVLGAGYMGSPGPMMSASAMPSMGMGMNASVGSFSAQPTLAQPMMSQPVVSAPVQQHQVLLTQFAPAFPSEVAKIAGCIRA